MACERSALAGVLDGRGLAAVFNLLRPNELVLNYWVNNYLLGKDPPRFDILAWNADWTNLPAALHGEFLDIFSQEPVGRSLARSRCSERRSTSARSRPRPTSRARRPTT